MKKSAVIGNLVLSCVMALVLPSVVMAEEFLPYDGKHPIQEGEGGTKKVIDGIVFWADGAPPRPFKLLGYISDRRHKTGLLGMIRMSGLEADVAAVAKANGGDAVILVAAEAETVGTVGGNFGGASGSANTVGGNTTMRASGSSTTVSSAVQKQQSKYAVVKYINRDASRDITLQPQGESQNAKPSESQPPTN